MLLSKTLIPESLIELGFLSQWLVMSASPMIIYPFAHQCFPQSIHKHISSHPTLSFFRASMYTCPFAYPCLSLENLCIMLTCPLASPSGVFISTYPLPTRLFLGACINTCPLAHQCLRTSMSACLLPTSVFLWRVHEHLAIFPNSVFP